MIALEDFSPTLIEVSMKLIFLASVLVCVVPSFTYSNNGDVAKRIRVPEACRSFFTPIVVRCGTKVADNVSTRVFFVGFCKSLSCEQKSALYLCIEAECLPYINEHMRLIIEKEGEAHVLDSRVTFVAYKKVIEMFYNDYATHDQPPIAVTLSDAQELTCVTDYGCVLALLNSILLQKGTPIRETTIQFEDHTGPDKNFFMVKLSDSQIALCAQLLFVLLSKPGNEVHILRQRA
jgi:hypothetical protein